MSQAHFIIWYLATQKTTRRIDSFPFITEVKSLIQHNFTLIRFRASFLSSPVCGEEVRVVVCVWGGGLTTWDNCGM